MTTGTAEAPPAEGAGEPPRTFLQRYYLLHPFYRVSARWVLIIVLMVVAFHRSLLNIAELPQQGSIGGYVWTVFGASVLVAVAIARRKRTELPIHDRQTDIIVGLMGMGLALLIQSVLLPRYALYFLLLRLDLVAAWFFLVSTAVLLFGLRPVIRFSWVWVLLLLVFSLPYYLTVVTLGGSNTAAGAAALLIAGLGAGIALGPDYRRATLGSLAAWMVGFAVLAVIAVFFPDAPVLIFQQIPPYAAIIVVGVAGYLVARRGQPKRLLERKVERIAAKQVWAAVPLVTVVAVVLAQFPLPKSVNSTVNDRPGGYPLAQGLPLVIPPGWTGRAEERFPANRLFGQGAVLVRQRIVADTGNPRWDKFARPRTVVVDSTVSERPYSFRAYPTKVFYGLTDARISDPREVALGDGVIGILVSVVDDELLVTWTSLQFTWGDEDLAQRVTLFAVDNHEPDAPFPEPTQNLFPVISTLLTLLFRGNAVLSQRTPSFKDAELLTVLGRALVAAQIGPPR